MKKIIITESQLKYLTHNILKEDIKVGGLITTINSDGTISMMVKNKPAPVKLRFYTNVAGEANIRNIEYKGNDYLITTKKGKQFNINNDLVEKIINYVNSENKNPLFLLSKIERITFIDVNVEIYVKKV